MISKGRYIKQNQMKRLANFHIILLIGLIMLISGCSGRHQPLAESIKKALMQLKDSTSAEMINLRIDSLQHAKNYSDKMLITDLVQTCYNMFGDGGQTDAILILTAATEHYENMRKLSPEETANLIQLYVPLGAAYEEIGMNGMAMNIYSRGIEHAREHNLQNNIAMLYNNIGVLYYNIDDYTQAEDYFNRALQINKKLNSKREIFLNYNNIAQINQQQGNLRTAMQNALTGMNYLDPERDSVLYYSTHTNIDTA
jgi:tetratricopeptide (TPR) repeat protein